MSLTLSSLRTLPLALQSHSEFSGSAHLFMPPINCLTLVVLPSAPIRRHVRHLRVGFISAPVYNGHAAVYQEYNESNNTSVVDAITPGGDGLWDFALKNNGAPANTSYCFHMVKSDSSLVDSHSQIPQITALAAGGGGGPALDQ